VDVDTSRCLKTYTINYKFNIAIIGIPVIHDDLINLSLTKE